MFGIYIGLLAIAEAIRPGFQIPKLPLLSAVALSIAIDLCLICKFFPIALHLHFST